MKNKDEISAEDLLDQLRKHIDQPAIPQEGDNPRDEEGGTPKTLEELFGHQFIRRDNHAQTRAVTKAQPIQPEKKQEAVSVDPTKAQIDETQYDLRAIFGMNQKSESAPVTKTAQPKKTAAADPYDRLSVKEKKQLAKEYRKKMFKQRVSIVLLALLTVFAFFWENATFLGTVDWLPSIFNYVNYPAAAGWMAIQLMVFAAVLLPEAFLMKATKRSHSDPTQIFVAVWMLHCLYLLVRILFFVEHPMLSFSLPVLFAGLLAKFYAYGALKREYLSFCVAFSAKDKYTLRLLEGDAAELERNELKDCMPEETRFFAVEKVRSVRGFNREIHTRGSVKRPIRLLIPGAIFMGICFGMIWWTASHSAVQALSVGTGMILIAMPFSLLYVFYAPVTALSNIAFNSGSAVIGERAMDEYAAPAVVVFHDSEVFPPEWVQLTCVKVFDQSDPSKVLDYASAIFCATGGALGDMFSQVVSDTGYTADMDFITVSDNGIKAAVNGDPVCIGSRAFLKEEGIAVDENERDMGTDDAVMYMAIGRVAVARIEVGYEMDENFESIARNLFRSGICVAIKTFDPNINRVFLEKRIRWGGDMPLKIIRGREKKDRILRNESAESLLLSSSQRGLFETVKFCRTTRNLMQVGVILACLSMLAAVPVFWVVLKMMGFEQLTSMSLLIYQLIWLLPILVITKLFG